MSTVRDIGIDVRPPQREPAPGDQLNPFNGSLPVRGATIVGRVVGHRMQGTVVVERQRNHFVPKFQRYEKRTNRYPAHLPSNIDVQVGDEVTIAECRPVSKTVHYVVVENRSGDAEGAKAPAKAAKKAPSQAKTSDKAPAKKTAKKATKSAAKTAKKETA